MEFDITHLDKKLLIQSLYAHSEPLNLGKIEYDKKMELGINVLGLTDAECDLILYDYNQLESGYLKILDYYKGKPMKLIFEKKKW